MTTKKWKKRSSGDYCAVVGCRNCGYKRSEWLKQLCTETGHEGMVHKDCPCLVPFSFNVFPRFEKERMKWVECIKRKDYVPNKRAVVCSVHFVDRKPTPANPYPTLRLDNPHTKTARKSTAIAKKTLIGKELRTSGLKSADKTKAVQRLISTKRSAETSDAELTEGTRKSSRLQSDTKREKARRFNLAGHRDSSDSENDTNKVTAKPNHPKTKLMSSLGLKKMQVAQNARLEVERLKPEVVRRYLTPNPLRTSKDKSMVDVGTSAMVDSSTQWEESDVNPSIDHSYSCFPNRYFKRTSGTTSSGFQCNLMCFTTKLMSDSDLYFYGGLSKGTFGRLVRLLQDEGEVEMFQMTIENQILLVLVRLRLGLLLGDLSRRFNVSTSIANAVFLYWLPIMVEELGKLIIWLPKESIQDSLPNCFNSTYPDTTCILGCTTMLMEKTVECALKNENSELAESFKCLLAVAPDGTIMFVSECFNIGVTNDYIIENSGILSYLSAGDAILSKDGFMIKDTLPPGVKLTFLGEDAPPLLGDEFEDDSQFCKVKIYAEAVTSKLKHFRILNSCAPMIEGTTLDDIVVVCAALCNLQPRAIDS